MLGSFHMQDAGGSKSAIGGFVASNIPLKRISSSSPLLFSIKATGTFTLASSTMRVRKPPFG